MTIMSTTATTDSTAGTEQIVTADVNEESTAVDWRDALPEEIKADPSIAHFKDVPSLTKSYISAQKLIGQKGIIPPKDDATPEEINEFYNKLGRPESADKYDIKLELPEGLEVDQTMLDGFKTAAHSAGLNNKQAAGLMNWYNENITNQINTAKQQEEQSMKEAVGELKKEWGHAYDSQLQLAQKTAITFDLVDEFNKLNLGNNPAVIKALAKIGKTISEDQLVGDSKAMIPLDARVQINKILADKSHPYHDKDNPSHDDAVKTMSQLFSQAYV